MGVRSNSKINNLLHSMLVANENPRYFLFKGFSSLVFFRTLNDLNHNHSQWF